MIRLKSIFNSHLENQFRLLIFQFHGCEESVESRSSLQRVVALNSSSTSRCTSSSLSLNLLFSFRGFLSEIMLRVFVSFYSSSKIFNLTAEKVHWLVIRNFLWASFHPAFLIVSAFVWKLLTVVRLFNQSITKRCKLLNNAWTIS